MNETICIYHGNCVDGFTAAWCVWEELGEDRVEYVSAQYNTEPPDVTGKDVIIVDFSYKADVLRQMDEIAGRILILDHHKSAAEDLAQFTHKYEPTDYETWYTSCPGGVTAIFDMDRSGAGLAWDFLHPNVPRPPLVNYVEDRDLWRFKMTGTRQIHQAITSHPFNFLTWRSLVCLAPIELIAEGEALIRKHDKDIDDLLPAATRTMVIGGYAVPVANLPFTMASDAGNRLAQGHPFAATYVDGERGRMFSLRSSDSGIDVSVVAREYGGGGHKHAAGFSVRRDHPLAMS